MNTIDLIVCIVLVLAVWNGFRQGIILQVCSLVGMAAGIWFAWRFGAVAAGWLRLDGPAAAPGGFIAVLVVVLVAVGCIGRILRRVFRFAGLGTVDRALGSVVAVAKYALILSAICSACDKFNGPENSFVDRKLIEGSRCYGPLVDLSESLFPFLRQLGEQLPDASALIRPVAREISAADSLRNCSRRSAPGDTRPALTDRSEETPCPKWNVDSAA